MTPPSRSRFPKGYSGFRPDLGEFLTGERRKLRIKQQTMAKVIGIARPSLSAIENGPPVGSRCGSAAGRRQEKLKLWQVAKKCNLSKAQLSRIERGEVTRSRFFVVGPQRLRFSDPELQRLADLAR